MTLVIISIILMFAIMAEIALFVLLFRHFQKTKRIFGGANGKKIMELLAQSMEQTEYIEKELERAFQESAEDRKILMNTLHKIGVVRFNPFGDMGGEQSFSLGLLNAHNSGFLITSLYNKDGVRTFLKKIDGGKSGAALSAEEERAVKEAMGQ